MAAALVVTMLIPHGDAADAATAKAQPSIVAPGAPVSLVFTVPAPTPLDADVSDAVTCAIRAPDGTSTPCGSKTALVTAEVAPADRSYSFETTAPKAIGNYTIHFERHSTLAIPSSDATADTVLSVLDASLISSGAPNTNVPGLVPGATVLPPLSSGAGSSDAARWLASLAMGTAAIVAGVVVMRPGGRP